jgi:DNA modification methylase
MSTWVVHHGDCLAVLPTLVAGSADAVVTSPPYAMQRAKQYGGIPEAEYPEWTVAWMREVRRVLVPTGSVLINIREHVRDGEMSDYVHRTRMALRADGWIECDEIVWLKRNAMPVGDSGRPRRSWERVLWLSPSRRPMCDATANGKVSSRGTGGGSHPDWCRKLPPDMKGRLCRHPDVADCALVPTGNQHPASFPVGLATYLVKGWSPVGGTVLDPFAGSGTTGVSCRHTGRDFVGIELSDAYADLARKRIAESVPLCAGAIP